MNAEHPVPTPCVLVADDDDDLRAIVAWRLGTSGYEVIQARDGAEALRLTHERRPDVAILDVTMPHLDGFEVTRRLRADRSTAGLPVILLTARVQDHDVAQGYAAGANRYLCKPFSPKELRFRVDEMLGRVD